MSQYTHHTKNRHRSIHDDVTCDTRFFLESQNCLDHAPAHAVFSRFSASLQLRQAAYCSKRMRQLTADNKTAALVHVRVIEWGLGPATLVSTGSARSSFSWRCQIWHGTMDEVTNFCCALSLFIATCR